MKRLLNHGLLKGGPGYTEHRKNKSHYERKFYVANLDVVADLKNVSKFVEK
jgi:hypothetical protein